jgi:5'-nucleotidase
MEAAIVDVPAVALSQRFFQGQMDFTPVKSVGPQVLAAALDIQIPPRTVLNINFPEARLGPVKGIKRATLDEHKFSDEIMPGHTPNTYRIGPLVMREKVNQGSDRWWLNEGFVTFTPLHMNATDLKLLAKFPEKDF